MVSMSELIYYMKCPFCGKMTDVMFGGSGRNGTCMSCNKDYPREWSYEDFEGRVISYSG